MKRKKAAKLARKFAKIKIELEELADDVQTSLWDLDGMPLRSIRDAVRNIDDAVFHIDDAVFHIDERACRK